MSKSTLSTFLRPLLWASWLGVIPASYGLDVHLQELPPAPGLTPSDALDPLDGMRNALNCGLDFLNTAKRCGLSSPQEAAAPFTVHFNPTFCRLTLRFSIGELIDGLLRHWIAGAFARISSPFIGALCLLGIGSNQCRAPTTAPLMSPVLPQSTPQEDQTPTPSEGGDRGATGLDTLTH